VALLGLSVFAQPAVRGEDTGAAPVDIQKLSETLRTHRDAVLLLGYPGGGYGTGFVISKKHRLVATNAHVADMMAETGAMKAIRNGSSVTYKVDKVYYHPQVKRIKDGKLKVSTDPNDGEVYARSPDVAVLHLEDDGQELPTEFQLAGWSDIEDLWAQPVGMIGFPGHDTLRFPTSGKKVQASARQGIVSHVTDFNLDPDAPEAKQQFVQYTQTSWGGFSGSPVFLPNGRVVALHNSARSASREFGTGNGMKGLVVRDLATGVRVDVLWELLEYHNMADKVSGNRIKFPEDSAPGKNGANPFKKLGGPTKP
jgi:S1-C subfamily serine protease